MVGDSRRPSVLTSDVDEDVKWNITYGKMRRGETRGLRAEVKVDCPGVHAFATRRWETKFLCENNQASRQVLGSSRVLCIAEDGSRNGSPPEENVVYLAADIKMRKATVLPIQAPCHCCVFASCYSGNFENQKKEIRTAKMHCVTKPTL